MVVVVNVADRFSSAATAASIRVVLLFKLDVLAVKNRFFNKRKQLAHFSVVVLLVVDELMLVVDCGDCGGDQCGC